MKLRIHSQWRRFTDLDLLSVGISTFDTDQHWNTFGWTLRVAVLGICVVLYGGIRGRKSEED